MTTKRNNKYKLSLQEIELKDGTQQDKSVTFEFENHDNILDIIDRVQNSKLFSEADTKQFVVGLKLFSEVMMKNKHNPVFADIIPVFGQFMKKFKGEVSTQTDK